MDDATLAAAADAARAEDELLEAATPADDMEEIEHDGQVYRIPKPLKGAFLMNADYTRKTQELAEHKRRLQGERAEFDRRRESLRARVADEARLEALVEDIAELESLDWEGLAAEDPATAEALWARYQQLGDFHERFAAALAERDEGERLEAEREMAAAFEAAGQELARDIQGWSPDVATKLVEFAQAFGVTIDELRQTADPRLWKLLHRAQQGEAAIRQQEAGKRAAEAASVRPAVQVIGAAGVGAGVRDELTAAEWMQRRNAQTGRGR